MSGYTHLFIAGISSMILSRVFHKPELGMTLFTIYPIVLLLLLNFKENKKQ